MYCYYFHQSCMSLVLILSNFQLFSKDNNLSIMMIEWESKLSNCPSQAIIAATATSGPLQKRASHSSAVCLRLLKAGLAHAAYLIFLIVLFHGQWLGSVQVSLSCIPCRWLPYLSPNKTPIMMARPMSLYNGLGDLHNLNWTLFYWIPQ